MHTEVSGALGHHLAVHLGREPRAEELALAGALRSLNVGGNDTLLRLDAVKARCGISRAQIYALVAEGRFPRPRRVDGTRVAVWSLAEVSAWISAQLAGGTHAE